MGCCNDLVGDQFAKQSAVQSLHSFSICPLSFIATGSGACQKLVLPRAVVQAVLYHSFLFCATFHYPLCFHFSFTATGSGACSKLVLPRGVVQAVVKPNTNCDHCSSRGGVRYVCILFVLAFLLCAYVCVACSPSIKILLACLCTQTDTDMLTLTYELLTHMY